MKKAQLYYWIIILAFGFGYLFHYQKGHTLFVYQKNQEMSPINEFCIGNIQQILDTKSLSPQNAKHIEWISPSFLGKYTFGDDINLTKGNDYPDADFIYSHGLDDEANFATDGLQIQPAPHLIIPAIEPPNTHSANFPVYIINETSSPKYLSVSVTAIQEALDSNGYWRPIEESGRGWCGVGRGMIQIHPNEFGIIIMPHYEGSFKTALRIRLKTGNATIFSLPYNGTINYDQFYFKKDSYLQKKFISYPFYVILNDFLGAIPLEFD